MRVGCNVSFRRVGNGLQYSVVDAVDRCWEGVVTLVVVPGYQVREVILQDEEKPLYLKKKEVI